MGIGMLQTERKKRMPQAVKGSYPARLKSVLTLANKARHILFYSSALLKADFTGTFYPKS